jgi:hypothetical protein
MGRKTVLLDDFDGKELPDETSPVRLSLGRTTYNLYLSEKNHGKLLETLEPFVKDAETQKSSVTLTPSSGKPSAADKEDQKNARAWAIASGFKYTNAAGEEKTLGDRGRIPDAVMEGWKAAGSPVMGGNES